ncbi:MAG: L-threonylcarbamoyladenylate synthase [Rikenellaceae bacterium]
MSDKELLEQQVIEALDVLTRGGIILYPTETVWGIGCDATNADAVAKIYALKRREDCKSMIVLTNHEDNVLRYVKSVPDVAWQLWEVSDKPLTLILPDGCGVASNLLPAERSIAIRISSNEFCRKLIGRLRRPLVSTSANISGEKTPLRFDQISEEILSGVDFVVDPRLSIGATAKSSSIIKLGLGGQIEIIR